MRARGGRGKEARTRRIGDIVDHGASGVQEAVLVQELTIAGKRKCLVENTRAY